MQNMLANTIFKLIMSDNSFTEDEIVDILMISGELEPTKSNLSWVIKTCRLMKANYKTLVLLNS